MAAESIMVIATNSIATSLRDFFIPALSSLGRRSQEELIANYTFSHGSLVLASIVSAYP